MNTLAEHNEDVKLELPRAWEPLDSSKPSQACEGPSSHGVFLMETWLDKKGFEKHCREIPFPNKFIVRKLDSGGGLAL